jgi:transcriptional regulator with XRE-family HTH domain
MDETLRGLRQKRHQTIEETALRSGRNISTISRIERGHMKASPETIVAIAYALGTSVGRVDKLAKEAHAAYMERNGATAA